MFVQFTENNEAEGETWHFWLQVYGNEKAIERLQNYIDNAEVDIHHPEFVMGERRADEREVDILVEHAEEGYMKMHTKITGTLTLPDDLEDRDPDGWFYKGKIEDYFE